MASWQFLTPDAITTVARKCYRFVLPDDEGFLDAFKTAVLSLLNPINWQEYGTMTPDEAAQFSLEYARDGIAESDWCMIGCIIPYVSSALPGHALACDGANYNRVDYPLLYAAIDPAFILDADTFFVPNIMGKFPLGATAAAPYTIGSMGGEVDHMLTVGEIPSHTHSDLGHSHTESTAAPNVTTPGELPVPVPTAVPSFGITGTGFANIQNTGGGGAHNNMPPFVAIKYAIIFE